MTEQLSSPLIRAPIAIRWRDLDAFNHVNNSNYLTFIEEVRLQWLKRVPGTWFDENMMPVLVASHINYRRPIEWPSEIMVELDCERMGTSSMTVNHRIIDAHDAGCVYADGDVVLVWVNPATGKPVPLPQAIRDAIGDDTAT